VDESTIADELAAAAEKYDPCGVTIGCYPYYEESGRDRGVRICPWPVYLVPMNHNQRGRSETILKCKHRIISSRTFLHHISNGDFWGPATQPQGLDQRTLPISPALISSSSLFLLFSTSQARTIVLVEGKSKSDVADCVEEILGKTPSAAVIFAEEGGQLGDPSHRRLSVP
jgi:hypothetical protein